MDIFVSTSLVLMERRFGQNIGSVSMDRKFHLSVIDMREDALINNLRRMLSTYFAFISHVTPPEESENQQCFDTDDSYHYHIKAL